MENILKLTTEYRKSKRKHPVSECLILYLNLIPTERSLQHNEYEVAASDMLMYGLVSTPGIPNVVEMDARGSIRHYSG